MTFSLIVPVYNVEKYLAKCLDSILCQSFQDFEIIVVNDGSPDNSQAIIDEYAKNHPDRIKAFTKENGGLSDARNFGIGKAQGDYLLFIDSDDYISKDLLCELNKVVAGSNIDLVRFSAQIVFENAEPGEIIAAPVMNVVSGEEAIDALIENKQYFEPACFYAYRRSFWNENNFAFAKGKYHEDFGLIPEVIMKSKNFSSIKHIGYYYVQTSSSITRGNNQDKVTKRANDLFDLTVRLCSVVYECNFKKQVSDKILSYLANAPINTINNLSGEAKAEYLSKIKEAKLFDLLLEDTFKRKLKKLYMKLRFGAFRSGK